MMYNHHADNFLMHPDTTIDNQARDLSVLHGTNTFLKAYLLLIHLKSAQQLLSQLINALKSHQRPYEAFLLLVFSPLKHNMDVIVLQIIVSILLHLVSSFMLLIQFYASLS